MDADFQALGVEQGRNFEAAAESILIAFGWSIVERHAVVTGVEIDIVADDPDGVQWWIECKGSHRGDVPGLRRGDTAKKAVATAWYLSLQPDARPYMLMTSHAPKPGSVSDRMLDAALISGIVARLNVLDLEPEREVEE